MRYPFILSLVLLIGSSAQSDGAVRTWKDRKGNEIKAEFTGGVLQNKLVLKASGNRRIYVRLSELSLEDRDYIVEELTAKDNQKDLEMLKGLMLAENQVAVIDPDVVKPAAREENSAGPNAGHSESTIPFNEQQNPGAANQPEPEIPTEMYGLPLPSPELLADDPVRAWTSLTGMKQMASFDRLLAPGFLRLKKADGTKGTFALVNFTKADIDYVKEALQRDMAREVFPAGNGFQSLTPDEVAKGYKVLTDRRNVPLIGKFIAVKGKNVVIEVAGTEQEYPKAGLSKSDNDWVDAEVKRRDDAAKAAAQQNMASSGQNRFSPFGSRPFGSSPNYGSHSEESSTGQGSTFPRTGFGVSYTHTCDHCGRTWTDSFRLSQCENCAGKYHFDCPRCGHKWTSTTSIFEYCPKCSAQKNSGASESSSYESSPEASSTSSPTGFSSPSTPISGGRPSSSNSGVYMTILYVISGIALLGGIAAGLFKTFG
jgi:hypothetical protein